MQDLIGYDEIIESSMRSVIYETLKKIEKTGLPGKHYFIVTFATKFPGVSVPKTLMEKYPELEDEYNDRDKYRVTDEDRLKYKNAQSKLNTKDKEIISKEYNYYEIKFKNIGGLVMPIIVELIFEDGTSKVEFIPAEIWRFNAEEVNKVFVTEKPVKEFILDPYLETADTDRNNNYFPQRISPTRFEMFRNRN
jgi:hypothetical protein